MKPLIKAIYIAVKDMERAVKFYESIFNVRVSSKDEKMSSFDFDNIFFLLYNSEVGNKVEPKESRVVPCVEVEDINKMFELVKKKGCEIVLEYYRVLSERKVIFEKD